MTNLPTEPESERVEGTQETAKVVETNETNTTEAKKKSKNKKKGKLAPGVNELPEVLNPETRRLKAWPAAKDSRQTWPPTIPVHKCYNKGSFPVGEVMPHPGDNGAKRMTDEEKRALDREREVDYDDIRRAAEAHRQTRKYVQDFIKPGLTTLDVVQRLEAKSKEMIAANGLETGWAFPTGISINHCAAHYTPNYGEDDVVIKYDDVLKIDYGVHVGGRLVDCAWTVAFNERYDPLLAATQDGTNTGLKEAGIDARFSEIGAAIEEAISSYEIELDGKTYQVKPISNLNGHTVEKYRVHGKKSLPIVATDIEDRMEEGEVYAIETFASTGRGKVDDQGACSHYMPSAEAVENLDRCRPRGQARALWQGILANFGTLAFCRRWLDDAGFPKHLLNLRSLVEDGLVNSYPPLVDVNGCYTSQMEHTVILRPTCKEVVTRGPDY